MTSEPEAADGGVSEFYDGLAPDYDAMTGFEGRFAQERPSFSLLVERHGIRTAVDAGAGSGFHSLLLAQLGVAVTAVDLSREMLERLGAHSRDLGLAVRSVQAPFDALPAHVPEPVDAVFCMGNAMAHLLTSADLHRALQAFHAVVRPGGILFAQILNYDRILVARERIQSVKAAGKRTFVRFYEFSEGLVRFNILTLDHGAGGVAHHLQTIELRPWRPAEIRDALALSGFGRSAQFGSAALAPFDPATSRDLVVLAHRS